VAVVRFVLGLSVLRSKDLMWISAARRGRQVMPSAEVTSDGS